MPDPETAKPIPIFEETQDPPWPFLALGVGAPAVGVLAAVRALGLLSRLSVAGVAATGIGLALREFVFPLHTAVLPQEIQVRFGRRTRFRIPLRNVVRAYARTYQPLREYGGWGIRVGPSGRAFNMRGNQGVQLELRSGQRVLLGSDRADALAETIRELAGCPGEDSGLATWQPEPDEVPAAESAPGAAAEEPAVVDADEVVLDYPEESLD